MDSIDIRRLAPGDEALVLAAADLFDAPPNPDATVRFLGGATNHLFIAYLDGHPAGFITGVELTHPDKGTEMFLYELSVGERHRRRGVATALVNALATAARDCGCYGMWVLTEPDNDAAVRTYSGAGGVREAPDSALFNWVFASG